MPELETPPRRLSPALLTASRTGRTQGPRSGLRAKAQLFAKALTRPSTGRFWAKRWAFDFIPEYICFNSGEAASAAGERQAPRRLEASTQTLESFSLLPSPTVEPWRRAQPAEDPQGLKREHGDEGV